MAEPAAGAEPLLPPTEAAGAGPEADGMKATLPTDRVESLDAYLPEQAPAPADSSAGGNPLHQESFSSIPGGRLELDGPRFLRRTASEGIRHSQLARMARRDSEGDAGHGPRFLAKIGSGETIGEDVETPTLQPGERRNAPWGGVRLGSRRGTSQSETGWADWEPNEMQSLRENLRRCELIPRAAG